MKIPLRTFSLSISIFLLCSTQSTRLTSPFTTPPQSIEVHTSSFSLFLRVLLVQIDRLPMFLVSLKLFRSCVDCFFDNLYSIGICFVLIDFVLGILRLGRRLCYCRPTFFEFLYIDLRNDYY